MKKSYKILFIIGMSFLGILFLLSVVGIIYSLQKPLDYTLLTLSSSIFISTISAVLTVGAMLITISSNDKLCKLQLNMQDISTRSVLNKMRSTLVLNKIELFHFLQPKQITDTNSGIKEIERNNLQIRLYFAMEELENLEKIGIRKLCIYTFTNKGHPPLTIKVNQQPVYRQPRRLNDKLAYYEIITNIDKAKYEKFCKYLLNEHKCEIGVTYDIEIMDMLNQTTNCERKINCEFDKYLTAHNIFVFKNTKCCC